MKHPKQPFDQALNLAPRQSAEPSWTADRREPFQTLPHAFGFRAGINLDQMNQLVDELDAEAFAERHGSQL